MKDKTKKIIEQAESKGVDIVETHYIVKAGDGLKKIARKLKKDYKKIAENNNLKEPYELFINQKLIIK